ncbi:MAG: YraN family protein [Pseudomonadota bacterium]
MSVESQASHAGRRNHLAGQAAEAIVANHYASQGYQIAASRWRGKSGELDLVFSRGASTVFVEVKKSRSLERAAESLKPRQIERILAAVSEYMAMLPAGQSSDVRIDVALLDDKGMLEVLTGVISA